MEATVTNLKLKVISQEDAQKMYDNCYFSKAKRKVKELKNRIEIQKENVERYSKYNVVPGTTNLYCEFSSEEDKQNLLNEIRTDIVVCEDRIKIYRAFIKDLTAKKKALLENASENFTDEQVKEYVNNFCNDDKVGAVVRNTWKYSMGRIGSTSSTIKVGKGKEKPLDRWALPDWRPIGYCTYYTSGVPSYMGGDRSYGFAIQSWDDVFKNLSSYDDQTMYLFKHPIQ